MNTLNTSSHLQTISNTTSLSNGILKKLAITLAVSAIGVSTLVPVAYAEGEVVAQPGDIITVEKDIYGISGNFAEGGTLTVNVSGTSFADDLREEAGEDGIIGFDEFFVLVQDYPYSPTAKRFKSLMGDKIDADSNMKVEDILSVAAVFDPEDDLPIADGLTRDEVRTLFTNTFGDKSSSEQIDRYINQLVFNESQNGENVYRGFELESLPLLRTMAENGDDDYRYRITALANIADDEGNITYENFQNILPAELFLEENDYYNGDGAENEDDGSDLTIGHQLLAKFQEEATDGKLSLGDAWALTYSDSGIDEDDIDEYKAFLNHVGKDLILTKAELDALGIEMGIETDVVNNFWNGLQPHVNDDGKVDITTAMAFLDVNSSANDFLQVGESEFNDWNDDGRVTTQNVAHVVNEAFNQAEYDDPNRSEADFIEPYVDPQKVITKLGAADANGTYDANAVYDAILDVYMAEWQVDFADGDQPKLNEIFDSAGNNGRISIDDYISLSGLTDEKETAVRAFLETAADDNGEVSALDAYSADSHTDFIEEIYTKTDVDSPLSVDEIIQSLPSGILRENKNAFEEQLEELTDENGTIARDTALDKLTEFVLANPGNELERIDGDGNVLGYSDEYEGNNPEYIGINLTGEKDLSLINNQVDIYAHNHGIFVSSTVQSGEFMGELKGDVSVVNSGDISSAYNGIYLAGKNVTLNNSGYIDRDSYFEESLAPTTGIQIEAEDTINITNIGKITVNNSSVAINSFSYAGDITIDNDGDLFTSGYESNGIQADSGYNRPNAGESAIAGGNVKLTNSGTIRTDGDFSYAIATWSNGGKVEVTNSGKLTTLQQGSAGIEIYSGTNRTQDDRVIQLGGDVSFNNSGVINTSGLDSHGIQTSTYGGAADGVNSGDISTTGNKSTAISISSGTNKTTDGRVPLKGGDVSLNNTGALSTQGYDAKAIDIWSNGGKVDLTNEGALTTVNNDSAGINAYSGTARTTGDHDVQKGDAVSVTNSGDISTLGRTSWGINAGSYGGTVDVDNSGDISIKGFNTGAINLKSGSWAANGTYVPLRGSDITLQNSGTLSTEDEAASTIYADSNGGKINITNSGKLTALKHFSVGIGAYSGSYLQGNGYKAEIGSEITIDNSGAITTLEHDSSGIDAISYGGAVNVKNSGKISTKDKESMALKAQSGFNRSNEYVTAQKGGDVTLENSESLLTDGIDSQAISTWSNGGKVSVTNSGELTTLKDDSSGIDIYSGTNRTEDDRVIQEGGDVSVNNSGAINTSGLDSHGIETSTYGGAADGVNSGNITTKGDNSQAISISSGTNKTTNDRVPKMGGAVTLSNSGALSTEGTNAKALTAWSNGGTVAVTNEGALTTLKENSAGIEASSGTNKTEGERVVQAGQAVSVTNSGAVSTAEKNSFGVFAGSYGGAVVVNNSENVSTKGDDSTGIRLSSGESKTTDGKVPRVGGALTLNNTGDVSTEGARAEALRGWTSSGNITASNEGKIVTGGEEANGIKLSSGNASENEDSKEQAGGDITLTNKGAIETTGNKAYNIKTWTNGGDITITNEAKLSATGDSSSGIIAHSGHEKDGTIITDGGDITINNTGEIEASGEDGVGIDSGSHGGDVKISNTGNVKSSGGGIAIEDSKNGELTNSGSITADNNDSGGLFVLAEDTATLTNTGNVKVEGQLGLAAVALNSASVENSGDVSLVRNWSAPNSFWNPAIGAVSLNDASLKNSGDVSVTGDNMVGLFVGYTNSEDLNSTEGTDKTKKATLENSGTVTTSGNDKAHAAYIKLDGTGTLSNSGALTTNGKTNAVVVEGTGDFTLDNSAAGVIEAKDGLAIVTAETTDKITNLGTLKGGATLASGDDILDNKGTLTGKFDFGDGKDTLTVSDFSKVSGATFDGGASDDIVTLSGGGEIAKDQIVNFETANFLSGDFSGDVMDKFTKMVNLEAGASLSGFTKVNNLNSKGSVSVAAGETLDVTGDLNIEAGKFNLGVDSTSKHAVVNVGGDASFASTSNLFINVADDGSITSDDSVTVLNGKTVTFGEEIASTLEGAEGEFDVDDDYISYDFSGRVETTSTGKSLILTARDSLGSTIEAVGEKFGGAIEYIASLSGDKQSEQNSVLTELETMIDNGQVNEAKELMNEVVSSPGASNIASTQNTNSFTAGNMVINRAAARIEGGFNAALSAEDASNILGYNTEYKPAAHIRNIMSMTDEGTETSIAATGYNGEIWMQVYGVRQENNGVVSGETDVFGGAAGIDFLVDPNTVIGLGLVYSTSDSDADTTNAHTDLETDSYGITAYGMTRFAEVFRLGGALAYYWNDHDLKRQILTNEMSASYDSTTFVARAEIGREFAFDEFTIMPQIGAIYTHGSTDAYTETGPLAQSIGKSETNSFIGTVGFVVDSQQDWGGMIVRPEFHMNVLHEFNDELGSFAGTLAADNTVSVSSTITSLEETRFNIGGGIKLNHTNAFASEFAYDGVFADNTQEHVFRYKASYKY